MILDGTLAHRSAGASLPSLREQLRTFTAAQHQQIEKTLDLMRPDLTAQRYRLVLERFYGFYAPLEAASSQHLDVTFFEPRRKLGGLIRDLTSLGCDATRLSLAAALPEVRTESQAMGTMYVTEGATLGGQIISRHIDRTFGITSEFFKGYGSDTGRMWAAFVERLGCVAPADANEVLWAAASTFSCLQQWFEEVSV